ncbi:hypothetical protein [Zymobacter palmae]|uniref:hypothetical protein n=1 Tax=Zymobacter palmae TaxID=33074 RepID=UPI0004865CF8|nr:hypothetical protein [Zymobacter palmae]
MHPTPIISGDQRDIFSMLISKLENGIRSPAIIEHDASHSIPNGKNLGHVLARQAIIALNNSEARHEDACIECLARLLAVNGKKGTDKIAKGFIDDRVAQANNVQDRVKIVREIMQATLQGLT